MIARAGGMQRMDPLGQVGPGERAPGAGEASVRPRQQDRSGQRTGEKVILSLIMTIKTITTTITIINTLYYFYYYYYCNNKWNSFQTL